MMMLILCDENMPFASVNYLKSEGYDVHSISESSPGITDEEVISVSIEEDRTIITFDSDFGTLIFRNRYKPHGVIYFRWESFRPIEPGEYLHKLLEESDLNFEGYLTVINRDSIRQRKIPK